MANQLKIYLHIMPGPEYIMTQENNWDIIMKITAKFLTHNPRFEHDGYGNNHQLAKQDSATSNRTK